MATQETDWRARLALIAACVILAAWTVSFILDVLVETYDPHPSITPLALATVGWLFGGEVISKLGSKSERLGPQPRPEEVET